ncbi:MAG: Fe-S cluster assembly protein SufD [Verrucomicrobiales bacterium]|jgi:Fe-S cluster assembly protein SufD
MSTALTLAPWLDALRALAATRFADAEAPSDADEVWRYSRISEIDLSAFVAPEFASSMIDPLEISGAAATVVVRDGRVVSIDRADSLGNATVQTISEHADGEALLNSVRGLPIDAVAHLHDANISDAVVIDVPRGAHIDSPIVIDVYSDLEGGLTCPHTIIRAGNGAAVTVLERRRSADASQLVVPTVELAASPDARVAYLTIQQLGPNTACLEHHIAQADKQAHVMSSVAAFGGSYARTRADCRLIGQGASGDLLSAYFGDGSQMLDFRTFQEHAAPDTTSNLLFKGAVTGDAQSVYTGLIKVAESAPGTNAFQTNRNLKLSKGAWAYSVPNLEIEQNQVSCSHASTVGEIDEDQRFYLESRGVPTVVAEQLLVSGFFAEVIALLPVEAVRSEMQSIIDDALAADRAASEVAS